MTPQLSIIFLLLSSGRSFKPRCTMAIPSQTFNHRWRIATRPPSDPENKTSARHQLWIITDEKQRTEFTAKCTRTSLDI
ncbi:uncharacterized protein C8Q71DRAFT_467601 [Rhodofomes roseus]|uniref:Secreted protein n=1 Tax=Rhodofomes roseus TaxID=34475 RepID=A0ABQ8KPW5_9APHY|nr:uncharacterized protein C8Q71DRAFT_467601 [Rhodofomes roseus]KAH9839902.1 hypothetical protein C8Q71DRAFT_467601 [Rhodofomes roseus]